MTKYENGIASMIITIWMGVMVVIFFLGNTNEKLDRIIEIMEQRK